MKKKRFLLAWSWLLATAILFAGIPQGYYNAAKGKKGAALKTALYGIIHNHTNVGYDGLFKVYEKSDVRADGKIWDMYSCVTNFSIGDHTGNYKGEGDVYNREHSLPQSWFKGASDAGMLKSDAFHVVPTDGYVNNRRSNYPFGEVKNATYTSQNGFSKVGSCSVSGYSGTVFEPNDLYKGDFARSYFYVATAYENCVSSFSGASFAGNKYPAFSSWSQTMFMRWASNDPVSEKEVNRNDAIYSFQKNRNPFIDFPGLEEYIWGDKQDVPFDPDNYDGSETPNPPVTPEGPAAPVFSPAGGSVAPGTQVVISCPTEGAYVYYAFDYEDGDDMAVSYASATVTIDKTTTLTAYAMLGENKSETVQATYTVSTTNPDADGNVYVEVTSDNDLQVNANYLIVCPGKSTALGVASGDIRKQAGVTIGSDNTIETETGISEKPYALTLGRDAAGWTLYDATDKTYLALTSDANKLHASTAATDKNAHWDIAVSAGGEAIITNAHYTDRSINYNSSSPRFACYKSTSKQMAVSLFKQYVHSTGIAVVTGSMSGTTDVYTLDGHLVRRNVPVGHAFDNLPGGIYIVGGKKVLIR